MIQIDSFLRSTNFSLKTNELQNSQIWKVSAIELFSWLTVKLMGNSQIHIFHLFWKERNSWKLNFVICWETYNISCQNEARWGKIWYKVLHQMGCGFVCYDQRSRKKNPTSSHPGHNSNSITIQNIGRKKSKCGKIPLNSANLIIWWVQIASGKKVLASWKNVW